MRKFLNNYKMRFNKKWETIVNNDENIITNEDYAIAGQARKDENNLTVKSYSPNTLFPYYPKKKVAFTLAEVLITLGIIGVVAAITIPTLIQKYNERTWVTQFKKVHSELWQAYLQISAEEGVSKHWNLENDTDSVKKVFDLINPYLNISKEFGFATPVKDKSGHKYQFKLLNGNTYTSSFFTDYTYNFVLNNGTIIGIGIDSGYSAAKVPKFSIDLNGFKGPNTLGKDMLYLVFVNKGEAPFISGNAKWGILYKPCDKSVDLIWGSESCANWIIATGNMDYLHRTISQEEWQNTVKNLTTESDDILQ